MRRNTSLSKRLEASLGEKLTEESLRHVTYGGVIQTRSGQAYFLKRGLPGRQYRCEAHGLHELGQTGEIAVADPVAVGEDFVLTRYVIPGKMPSDFFTVLGRSLARVHRHTAATFGFYEDNFIGATPQLNRAEGAEKNDWTVFYFQKRLKYQYRLAERNGYVSSSLRSDFAFLERHLPEWLKGSEEAPCLIHGGFVERKFFVWSVGRGCIDRSGRLLRTSRSRIGHDTSFRGIPRRVLSGLYGGISASRGVEVSGKSLSLVSSVEPSESLWPRLFARSRGNPAQLPDENGGILGPLVASRASW